jgi:hypothetical protein
MRARQSGESFAGYLDEPAEFINLEDGRFLKVRQFAYIAPTSCDHASLNQRHFPSVEDSSSLLSCLGQKTREQPRHDSGVF